MYKFIISDWDIETEIEIGNDDFIYGNYVDWDQFRADEEENILSSFEIDLPWGQELLIDEYLIIIEHEFFKKQMLFQSLSWMNL